MTQVEKSQYLSLQQTMPLLNPKYPPEYQEKFTRLKKIIEKKQFDQQANELAEELTKFGESNYNCWYVKKMCYLNKRVSYEHQLEFSQRILFQKIKNFQVWEHRRFLSEHSNNFENQYQFINQILKIESKNYHAWSYRIWVVDHVQDYLDQIQFTHQMLQTDPYNNSVWSYRYHLFNKIINQQTNQQQKQKMILVEIVQTLMMIQRHLNNQAAWNYLRGFFPSIKLKSIPCQNQKSSTICKSYSEHPKIYEFVKYQLQKLQKLFAQPDYQPKNYYIQAEIQLLITLVCIESQTVNNVQYAKNTCLLLGVKQKQKQYYWKWVAVNLVFQEKQSKQSK